MAGTGEDARKLAIHSIELMAGGELADFEAIIHPEATNREGSAEPPAARGTGPVAYYASAEWLRSAYTDLRWDIHEVVVDGDLVALHTTMHGRQIGTFIVYGPDAQPVQAMPSLGKRFAVTQSHWIRIADGKIIEHWANRDDLGQAAQLGWIPPTPVYLLRMRRALGAARKAAQRH
ncbi:ester cyclase [Nocardia sp. NPDC046763]|uniref:ester cyclase n=1 Tax=Nocardia sp. NPDC046763 TaxID=3155256 RepID=UPI0033CD1683